MPKEAQQYYWKVTADGLPTLVVTAGSTHEAKAKAGYRGKKGVFAEIARCEASCHWYVQPQFSSRVYAERKDPVEGYICLGCDAHLRKTSEARIQELEEEIVELRGDIEALWNKED